MTRTRLFTLGCLGSIVLIAILAGITWFAFRGPYDLARARWTEKGSGDYSLVVMQYCACSPVGQYRLTVKGGKVTSFESMSSDEGPYGPTLTITTKPDDFQHLTVASMLAQAEKDQVELWISPFMRQIDVTYDPAYGYVTSFSTDPNGTLDDLQGTHIDNGTYLYTASDLVITEP